jgi:hypothetical protein
VNPAAARIAHRYRCSCQHALQVFGGGRHRRNCELTDVGWEHPLMARVCPACQRQLPGRTRNDRHRPSALAQT